MKSHLATMTMTTTFSSAVPTTSVIHLPRHMRRRMTDANVEIMMVPIRASSVELLKAQFPSPPPPPVPIIIPKPLNRANWLTQHQQQPTEEKTTRYPYQQQNAYCIYFYPSELFLFFFFFVFNSLQCGCWCTVADAGDGVSLYIILIRMGKRHHLSWVELSWAKAQNSNRQDNLVQCIFKWF